MLSLFLLWFKWSLPNKRTKSDVYLIWRFSKTFWTFPRTSPKMCFAKTTPVNSNFPLKMGELRGVYWHVSFLLIGLNIFIFQNCFNWDSNKRGFSNITFAGGQNYLKWTELLGTKNCLSDGQTSWAKSLTRPASLPSAWLLMKPLIRAEIFQLHVRNWSWVMTWQTWNQRSQTAGWEANN